ncbi:PIG-L deacetylase family protein [Methylobacterium aerolatum]|uniref:LmbE family N-acetylglucosaminyl deacetylase n=1 Tax=Methylobacterium aerolatum TaxID=418708 RepID=A0ABU0HXV0_9HYPH|nr:PIG-L family deacetylase [Methylobacterium aerolatum]MDQ0446309.1 LmbE family N-acetylglucosaminyl deacetylase [Methylobacterium aerolatum]GJD35652.1 1D-myo-inositol 2-acetamido-2-deoxy-alpha-D-glucopyranoside deacetylase [Methylobacterium aerolatum]
MRADAFLAAADLLPLADLATLAGEGGLVVVAPHPDDESLGCGGLIAAARAAGRDVRLVVVSDGCGSHTHSELYPPARLRDLREDETRRAVTVLGMDPGAVTFLRLPDAHVPSEGRRAEDAAAAIVEAASACRASAVFVTWRHDPHCDHKAAAAIVALARKNLPAVRIYEYPVWGWTLPPETEVGAAPEGLRLDVSAFRATKAKAVGAHESQTSDLIHDDPTGFRLEPEMIDRLCGPFERFVAIRG